MELAYLNVFMMMERNFTLKHASAVTQAKNPCGGGVEYLHRDPASRKRRRNGAKKGRAIA
jgi:hypothetical protein